ncbi:MAG: ABC transporter permease [Clostridia bacterium]|nr:ABC transporter permease [Clostridia bacterium]
MKKTGFFSKLYIALMLIFMQMPIIVLMVYSFNDAASRANWGGFSLRWYEAMFRDATVMNSLWVTLACGILAAVLATVIGTLAAIGLNSMKKRAYSATIAVAYLPMLNAEIVTGVSLFMLYTKLNMQLGFVTLLISHITFCLPYVILSVMPKVRQFDYSKYEAAIDLGAKPSYAITRIMLPELAPGIISGFILSLTLSIDDFVISKFTTGNGVDNLSTLIYSAKGGFGGMPQKISALSTVIYVVVLTILIINYLRTRKSDRENLF